MNYTLGPWRLISADDEYTIHAPGHGTIIATIHPLMPERPANARLIAASPDLLAALEAALDIMDNMTSVDFAAGFDKPVRESARAAVAAAKGETAR